VKSIFVGAEGGRNADFQLGIFGPMLYTRPRNLFQKNSCKPLYSNRLHEKLEIYDAGYWILISNH